jgi:hypothetical protein
MAATNADIMKIQTKEKSATCGSGGEGGILNQALELSCHVFSNMRENRMDIGDFHGLASCNCFYPSA